jgi:hypothetical protein
MEVYEGEKEVETDQGLFIAWEVSEQVLCLSPFVSRFHRWGTARPITAILW